MAGFRYQYLRQSNLSAFPAFGFSSSAGTTDAAVTPRVGLLWQPRTWLSLYSNYVENFGPNNGYGQTADSKEVPPTSAHQWELGTKTTLLDGRLSATVAYYELAKTNIPTTDPANPQFVVVTGEALSRGWEFDVQGEIVRGWNVIANYANDDVRVTKSSPTDTFNPPGTRFAQVPRSRGNLWSTYEFQSGSLRGLKLGVGATAQGNEPYLFGGTSPLRLPGYASIDAMAGYGFRLGAAKCSVQLNATNLLDQRYITNSELPTPDPSNPPYGTQRAVIYGSPRSFLGSLRIEL